MPKTVEDRLREWQEHRCNMEGRIHSIFDSLCFHMEEFDVLNVRDLAADLQWAASEYLRTEGPIAEWTEIVASETIRPELSSDTKKDTTPSGS